MKKILLFGTMAIAAAAFADDSVLWFMVDADAVVQDGSGTTTKLSEYVKDGVKANAARIRVDGADDAFLNIYYRDGVVWKLEDGLTIAELDENYTLSWQPASFGDYASGNYSFLMELGNYNANALDEFRTIAYARSSYNDLVAAGHTSSGGVSLQTQTPWNPHFMAVPEPTGSLLLLLGAAGLVLRRRRVR